MQKKILKNEKDSITAFVLLAILFFLINEENRPIGTNRKAL